MAVTEVELIPDGRQAQWNAKGQPTFTRVWRITTDAAHSEATILADAYGFGGFPARWDPHPDFFGVFLLDVTAVPDESRRRWTATGVYRVPQPGEEKEDDTDDPLLRPTKYHLEHENYIKLHEKDRLGKPIVNKAKQPFDEPVETEVSRLVLVAQKNYATLDEIITLNTSWVSKVNSDTYRGGAARTWLVRPIQCSRIQEEHGIKFYTATFRVSYDPKTWDISLVNRGYKYINAAGKLEQAKDDSSPPQFVSEPVLLDTNGGRLPDNTDGNTVEFQVYTVDSFATFPV